MGASKDAAAPAHQGAVIACAFLGGPEQLATGSVEGAVVIWDVEAGEIVRRIPAHVGPVFALAWDGARRRIISAGHDRRILALDPSGRAEPLPLGTHEGGIFAVAITPDEETLASAGYDQVIRLWRLDDSAPLGVLTGHSGAVLDLDVLPDGGLVSCGRDNQVIVWDIASRAERFRIAGHERWPMRVRASADGKHIFSAGEDGRVCCWSADDGAKVWRRRLPAPVWGLGVTPDGAGLIAGMGGGVMSFDLGPDGPSEPRAIAPETARAIAVCDAGLVALGADADKLLLYRPGAQTRVRRLGTGARLSSALAAVRAPGDQSRFATVIGRHQGMVQFGLDGREVMVDPPHLGLAFAACAVGGGLLATGGFDGKLHLRHAVDGGLVRSLDHGGFVFSVGASRDGGRLLAAGHDRLSFWNPMSGERLWAGEALGIGFHLWGALSADGATILAGGEGPDLHLWRFGGAEPAHRILRLDRDLPIGTCGLMGMTLLGERTAAVGDSNGEVRRVDLETGRTALLHAFHEAGVRGLQASPDGRWLLSFGENSLTALYDLAEGHLATPPQIASAAVPAATFTPGGDLVWVDGLSALHALPAAMLGA
jgi:WD40 repeat protein